MGEATNIKLVRVTGEFIQQQPISVYLLENENFQILKNGVLVKEIIVAPGKAMLINIIINGKQDDVQNLPNPIAVNTP